MTTQSAAVAALFARAPENKIEPTLDRIRALLAILGDPQLSAPVIIVAGTNGKTSTARMVETLLRGLGLRVGLFTSPHLKHVSERVLVDGKPLDDEAFEQALAELLPFVEIVDAAEAAQGRPRLTFFEVLTALAYTIFADAPVDVAVMEVGLGGTWDSTNVVDAPVAVVTPIDMDHMEWLGDTIELIAAEKAGVIKEGTIAVVSRQTPTAAGVLTERAVEVGAALVREGVEFGVVERNQAVGGQLITLGTPAGEYTDILLPLNGEYQASNAAAALTAVEVFASPGRMLAIDVVRDAFAEVTSPGRLEVIRRGPTVLVDAAHNPAGARSLRAGLAEAYSFEKLVAVIAMFTDKDAVGFLEELVDVFDDVVVTQAQSPRSRTADELAAIAVDVFGSHRVVVEPSLALALDTAIALADETPGAGVVVTGSISLVGDARTLLAPDKPVNPEPVVIYREEAIVDDGFDIDPDILDDDFGGAE